MSYSNWNKADEQRRKHDELQEKVIGQFLDDYFYSTFTTGIDRNTDITKQIHGLDLTITSLTSSVYTIDEKAAVKWANKNLQTFAFEVNSLDKNGDMYDGWFLSKTDEALNDYWLLVWVDSASTVDFNSVNDIQQVTVSLLYKQDVFDWMHRNNIHGKELKQEALNLRQDFNLNQYHTHTLFHGLKLRIEPIMSEHTINLLLPRKKLENDMATFSAIVTRNGITPIRKKMGI